VRTPCSPKPEKENKKEITKNEINSGVSGIIKQDKTPLRTRLVKGMAFAWVFHLFFA
jgi:hypothetical protein